MTLREQILTVIWKEWQEINGQLNNQRRGRLLALGLFFVTGTALPLTSDSSWAGGGMVLLFWLMAPYLFTSQMVADSFAGERERHTLETLLASPLPDRAIYYGKLLTPTLVVWVGTQLWIFYTLIPFNIVHGGDGLQVFPLEIAIGGIVLSFMLALTMCAVGVLASMHAPSTQNAQTRIGTILMVIFTLPLVLGGLAFTLPTDQLQSLIDMLTNLSIGHGLIIGMVVLGLLAFGLIRYGLYRFRRSRMILDLSG